MGDIKMMSLKSFLDCKLGERRVLDYSDEGH